MFLWTEIKWQMIRNKGRNILLALAAAALCGCMVFYLGNIRSTEAALDNLSQSIPVEVQVTNHASSRSTLLKISSKQVDALEAAGVHEFLCTAEAAGAWSGEAKRQEPFAGGDTTVIAANSTAALTPAAEVPEGFFASHDGQCVLSSFFSKKANVTTGDQIILSLYSVARSDLGNTYVPVGEAALTVAGIYQADAGISRPVDMYVPVKWLRSFFEENGKDFTYTSCAAKLDDPKELNGFKAALPAMGFMAPDPAAAKSSYTGDTLAMDDELFIKTAGKMKRNLRTFQIFLLPAFGLIFGLIVLLSFLILRNSRREMAVALSLGRPRYKIGLTYFCVTLFTDLFGIACILPAALFVIQLPFLTLLMIFSVFLSVALCGAALSLWILLRFDAMELLTKVD